MAKDLKLFATEWMKNYLFRVKFDSTHQLRLILVMYDSRDHSLSM